MNFKVENRVLFKPRNNTYKIELGFMLGDGDHYETVDIYISKDTFESNNEKLSRFVKSILRCIEHDNKGRRGIFGSDDLTCEYIGIEDWSFFCDNVFDSDLEGDIWHSNFISYEIPIVTGKQIGRAHV